MNARLICVRLICMLFISSCLAALVGCKKTGDSDRPTASKTTTRETSAPGPDAQPESQPQSQPESAPASAQADAGDLDSGPWVYSRSIGKRGDRPGQFREPVGLAVTPDGVLFVSDTGNERLQKLSAKGESLAVFAEGVARPMHLGWSGAGHLTVAVFLEDRIRLFDDTREAGSFGGDWLDAPAAAVQGKDGRFYVADFYHHQYQVVSADGRHLKSIGEKGEASGQFTYPTDVALDADGNVWVADAYAHRLQKFDADGGHLETIGRRGTAPGRFEIATGIDVGPEGLVYVADFGNDRVQVLTSDGTPTAILGADRDGGRSMERPTDVVATESRLYVVDHGHHQIDVWERR